MPSPLSTPEKRPVHHPETDDLLGFVVRDSTSWQAQTIFGFAIARTPDEETAEQVLHAKGLSYLKGIWQYYDTDDHDWFPCIIKEAYEQKVIVIRTNFMGYQNPDDFKVVTIEHPDENTLIKSS